MITVQHAAARWRTERGGITTWHGFSSGAHYDPDNVSFGPLIACDEHVLAGGAGFERHAHMRVELVSWVLSGVLQHEDSTGRRRTVEPGEVQHQVAGRRIEHAEGNASAVQPLRFVQFWLLTDVDEPRYARRAAPLSLTAGRFVVLGGRPDAVTVTGSLYAYVARGRFTLAAQELRAGDSLRAVDDTVSISGLGELLILEFPTGRAKGPATGSPR